MAKKMSFHFHCMSVKCVKFKLLYYTNIVYNVCQSKRTKVKMLYNNDSSHQNWKMNKKKKEEMLMIHVDIVSLEYWTRNTMKRK